MQRSVQVHCITSCHSVNVLFTVAAKPVDGNAAHLTVAALDYLSWGHWVGSCCLWEAECDPLVA